MLVETVVALYMSHHSLLIPMGYNTVNREYLRGEFWLVLVIRQGTRQKLRGFILP